MTNLILGISPVILPIISGGGGGDINILLAALIVIDSLIILYWLILSAIWLFGKRRESYLEYVLWDDYEGNFCSMAFILINGLAIIIWLTGIVYDAFLK